jgi:hypothetical protein
MFAGRWETENRLCVQWHYYLTLSYELAVSIAYILLVRRIILYAYILCYSISKGHSWAQWTHSYARTQTLQLCRMERLQGRIQEVWLCNAISFTVCYIGFAAFAISATSYWCRFITTVGRYASLYFCMCIDADDNELEVLEIIHHFVEILDRYFGSVSASVFFLINKDSFFHVIVLTVFSITSLGMWTGFDIQFSQGNP